jgi:predicted O-methyltransferase YrrM
MIDILSTAALILSAATLLMIAATHIYQRRTRKIMRQLAVRLEQHVWSTVALHHTIIPTAAPLPSPTDARLSSDLLAFLTTTIVQNKPLVVLELGSGLSTVVLGQALRKSGGHLFSIESDTYYFDETKSLLSLFSLEEQVTLIHAPLEKIDESNIWYRLDALRDIPKINLLLIDGPPATTRTMARYPALSNLWEKLDHDAIIILDDGDREGEQSIAYRWKVEHPVLTIQQLPYGHAPFLLRRRKDAQL